MIIPGRPSSVRGPNTEAVARGNRERDDAVRDTPELAFGGAYLGFRLHDDLTILANLLRARQRTLAAPFAD